MIRMSHVGKALQGLCLTLLALTGCLAPSAAQAQTPDTRTWYLAEGAAINGVFEEEILVSNPNPASVQVRVTLLPAAGDPVTLPAFPLAALGRKTINLNDAGIVGAYSARVECIAGACTDANTGIVVERTMFMRGKGGHTSQGLTSLSKTWFLAEGATGFFNTYVLLANPGATTANITLTYLFPGKAPMEQTVVMSPTQRRTVWVNDGVCNQLDPAATAACGPDTRFLTGQAFSVSIVSDVDIAVERAMYWHPLQDSGHESTAVLAPSQTWLFGEGINGGGGNPYAWSTYFLLVNPGTTDATFKASFLLDGNPTPIVCEGTAPVGSRVTIDTADLGATLTLFGATTPCDPTRLLSGALFATTITSDQPIVAERTVYWSLPGQFWIDGHNSPGVNAGAPRWVFAEGSEGLVNPPNGRAYRSYFLVSNPTGAAVPLKATFVREDGKGVVWEGSVGPQQRATIEPGALPELRNARFASYIEAKDGVSAIVAERTMYWGAPFYGGTGATGTPWNAAIGTLDPASYVNLTPVFTDAEPNNGSVRGGMDVTIHGANFFPGLTQVLFDNTPANVRVLGNDLLVARAPAHSVGAVSITITNPISPGTTNGPPGGWTVTKANAFTYLSDQPVLDARFLMGFGDSVTFGVSSRWVTVDSSGQQAIFSYDMAGYPPRVFDILKSRYPDAPLIIDNQGLAGERVANDGKDRFKTVMNGGHDLVILLEGYNDLNAGTSVNGIIDALRSIVENAKAKGKRVIICNLTPGKEREDGLPRKAPDLDRVMALNAAIDVLKTQQGIPRVDLWAAFGSDYGRFLSPDGLHPNEAGYQRIASAIAEKIIESYGH